MNARRRFLASTLGLALAPIASAAAPEPKEWRRFHRFDHDRGQWVPTRFETIMAGDEIWIDDSNPAMCEVVLVERGYHDGMIDCSHRIDPKTNQWVAF